MEFKDFAWKVLYKKIEPCLWKNPLFWTRYVMFLFADEHHFYFLNVRQWRKDSLPEENYYMFYKNNNQFDSNAIVLDNDKQIISNKELEEEINEIYYMSGFDICFVSKEDFLRFWQLKDDELFLNTRPYPIDFRINVLQQIWNYNQCDVFKIRKLFFKHNTWQIQLIWSWNKDLNKQILQDLENNQMTVINDVLRTEYITRYGVHDKKEYEAYFNYIKEHGFENAKKYAEYVKALIKKELDQYKQEFSRLTSLKSRNLYYEITKKYHLNQQFNQQIAYWIKKYYVHALKKDCLSLYEKTYYQAHQAEYQEKYTSLDQQFELLCQKTRYEELNFYLNKLSMLVKLTNNMDLSSQIKLWKAISFKDYLNFKDEEKETFDQNIINLKNKYFLNKEKWMKIHLNK